MAKGLIDLGADMAKDIEISIKRYRELISIALVISYLWLVGKLNRKCSSDNMTYAVKVT